MFDRKEKANENKTRKLNPKLGFLGFLGFAGFAGIWSYQISNDFVPFIFFVFFGFFGFFLEGKMSNTLMDERYIENRKRAQLQSYHLGFRITFLVLIASSWRWLFPTNESAFLFMTISLSITLGIVVFLSEYLLYRYDSDNNDGE